MQLQSISLLLNQRTNMHLYDLPTELLQRITSYLSPSSALAVALTSRVLFEVAIEYVWTSPSAVTLASVANRSDSRNFNVRERWPTWVGGMVRRAPGQTRENDKDRMLVRICLA
ncbi:hypothetical protein CALCODRAFT_182937 [Calocera cornea HHB12733]|uniref:F-box domain-containing protein n=1 Tax=Calocera cornea HHB12733 TaxID=1353952 RepID=A0A165HSG0_9BASI|nr:hypothetical protein CALCODRAFT_182937 [Calocera cornea HHB12733]